MVQIVLLFLLLASFVLHFLLGPVPVGFFAFPLNVIMMLLWTVVLFWLWNRQRKSLFVIYMLSPSATFWAIGLLLVFSLAVGFTGMRWLVQTWPFFFVMTYFITVLTFVILRGWRAATPTGARLGEVRWRFLFLHVGLLLAIVSAYIGAPDNVERQMRIFKGGSGHGANMELVDFHLDSYANGVPSDYRADMVIDGEEVCLRVNHPYSRGFGEDVYLVGYDKAAGAESDYCVIQIVRQPWKYGVAAGIVILLTGCLLMFIGGPRRRYSNEID